MYILGPPTHEPGVFDIEAENTTPRAASFAVYELAPGFSIKDVRGFFQRVMVAHDRGEEKVKPPTPAEFRRSEVWTHAAPRTTTLLQVNAPAGRFVIVCLSEKGNSISSTETQEAAQDAPFPAAFYVPAQLEIR